MVEKMIIGEVIGVKVALGEVCSESGTRRG